MRAAVTALLVLLAGVAPARAQSGSAHVRVELLASDTAVVGGRPFTLAVRFDIDPGWHVYWTNPGDSGLPTRVKLRLPAGFTAGPVEYPVPAVLKLPGGIVNFGYQGSAVLMATVRPPDHLSAGQTVPVSADVDYLVCNEVCLPGSAKPAVELHAARPDESVAVDADGRFARWSRRLPASTQPADVAAVTLSAKAAASEAVTVDWKVVPGDVAWLPDLPDGWTADDVTLATAGRRTTITYALNRNGSTASLTPRRGLLTYSPTGNPRVGVYVPLDPVRSASSPTVPERTRP